MYFFGGGGGDGKGLDTCVRFKGSVEIRRSKMLFVLFFDANSKKFLFPLHFKSDMLFLVEGKGFRTLQWPENLGSSKVDT